MLSHIEREAAFFFLPILFGSRWIPPSGDHSDPLGLKKTSRPESIFSQMEFDPSPYPADKALQVIGFEARGGNRVVGCLPALFEKLDRPA